MLSHSPHFEQTYIYIEVKGNVDFVVNNETLPTPQSYTWKGHDEVLSIPAAVGVYYVGVYSPASSGSEPFVISAMEYRQPHTLLLE